MDIYGHGNRGQVNDAEHWPGVGGSNKLMISRLQLVLFLDLDHDLGPLLWFKQNYFLICYESKTWRQIYPSCFTLWRGRRVVNSNRGGQDELGQEPGLHQNSEWGDHSGTLFQPFGQQRALSLLFWKRKKVTEWFPGTIFWKTCKTPLHGDCLEFSVYPIKRQIVQKENHFLTFASMCLTSPLPAYKICPPPLTYTRTLNQCSCSTQLCGICPW